MSSSTIFMYAIGVFTLMVIGMILTMIEFNRLTDEPSLRKGAGPEGAPQTERPAAKIRVVHSNESAA
jgi:hypothetical protein